MSRTGMWVVIVIIVLLAIGAWWYSTNYGNQGAQQQTAQVPPPPPPPPTAPTPPPPPPTGISQDSSNAGLDADLKTADTQIQAADSANTSASSFTDTPVTQTE